MPARPREALWPQVTAVPVPQVCWRSPCLAYALAPYPDGDLCVAALDRRRWGRISWIFPLTPTLSPREREYYWRQRPKCCSGLLKRLCHRQECCGMLRGHSSEHLETYSLRSKANINGPAQGSLPFTNWSVQGSLRFSPALSPGGRLTNASLRVDLPFDPSTGSGRTKPATVRSCRVLRKACCAQPAFPRRPSHKCIAPCRLALRQAQHRLAERSKHDLAHLVGS